MLIKEGCRRIKSIWECDACGKNFEVVNTRAREAVKKKQKKFCSSPCRLKYQKEIGARRVIDWVKKNGHPKFKGGVGITTDGYVWILIKNNGYHHDQVKLHRYLMEVKIGRKLSSNEIVHHINGDKFDNRIENLKIVSRGEHNKIHRFLCKD